MFLVEATKAPMKIDLDLIKFLKESKHKVRKQGYLYDEFAQGKRKRRVQAWPYVVDENVVSMSCVADEIQPSITL